MRLLLLHPELPTCADCQTWRYNPETWQRIERPRGTPVPMPAGGMPPCRRCPKIPKGAEPRPAKAIELTEQSWAIYAHYQRCKAVGRFPRDPWVERHAGLIRMVEDQVERSQREDSLLPLVMALAQTRKS